MRNAEISKTNFFTCSRYPFLSDLRVLTATRSFGPNIKGKSKVGRFIKGAAKRALHEEREVLLAAQSSYSFTLRRPLQIQ